MELQYGLALNPARAKKLPPIINVLLEMLTVIPYEPIDASATVMIAGCALSRQLIMVTSNTKEFNRVIGLTLGEPDQVQLF